MKVTYGKAGKGWYFWSKYKDGLSKILNGLWQGQGGSREK